LPRWIFSLGNPAYLGKELGAVVLGLFLEKHVVTHFSACLVDPEKANLNAIKPYKNAGFKTCCKNGQSVVMVANIQMAEDS
jgi:hypothetical protein